MKYENKMEPIATYR